MINEIPLEDRLSVLRKYKEYENYRNEIKYKYKMWRNKKLPKILEKYDYQDFMKETKKDTDELAFQLLNFVSSNFRHNGEVRLPLYRRMKDIIVSAQNDNMRTNCRGLSIILAELLRANGIKARHVTCKPYEEPFCDCHVVVDCILPSGKRVMLDPTYCLYLKDDKGNYVSLRELREGIIEGKTFFQNINASYNGDAFHIEQYLTYMAKNTVRFTSNVVMADLPIESESIEIELIPAGYPVEGFSTNKKFVYNVEKFWDI